MIRRIVFLALAFAMLVPAVNAQGLRIGPQVGYHKSKDANGNYMLGAAARLKLTPALAIEGSVNYRAEEFENLTVRSWPIMVTGLFYPLPIVYGAVGAGWYNTTSDFDDALNLENTTQREVGWHFGGGVEMPFGSNKLTFDVRYVFLDYQFDEVPFSKELDSNFYVLSVGLLFGL